VERALEHGRVEQSAAAVVLAAGGGTRFAGGAKLLAPFRGRPLLAWALQPVLEAGLPLVVVRGAVDLSPVLEGLGHWIAGVRITGERIAGERIASVRIEVVDNPRWQEGQATSLRAGIEWCARAGFAAAVVGLGDQPLVPASCWRAVAASRSAPIVAASFRGQRRPPVRLDREVWELLGEVGDEGARELMRRRPDLVAEVACEGAPVDVDTVDDLLAYGGAGPVGSPGDSPRLSSTLVDREPESRHLTKWS
jgi:molybdenum cofactor cytidylyltransferase